MPKRKYDEEQADPIEATIAFVNAKMNAGAPKKEWKSFVARASSTVSPFKMRRPTGILSLDIALAGGFPAGGITQIASPDGVGKNAMCHQTVGQCQQIYREESAIAWVCTEFALDKPFAHKFGVRVPMSEEEIELENAARARASSEPLSPEEVERLRAEMGTFLVVEQGTSAQRLETVVDLVKSNLFQIIVLDSIAALLTEQRDEKPLDQEPQQSSEARLVTEFQKKLWGAFSPNADGVPNWTTLLVVNQVKANRNAVGAFKRAWTVGGAHALRHGKLGDIWLTRGESIIGSEDVVGDDDEGGKKRRKIGKEMKWEIAKGKAGFHDGPTGAVDYHYSTGFQTHVDLVDTALRSGVLRRDGKTSYVLIDEGGEVVESYVGKPALYEAARDRVWFDVVYDLTLKKEGVSCIYKL
jgi:recombination protein RecA